MLLFLSSAAMAMSQLEGTASSPPSEPPMLQAPARPKAPNLPPVVLFPDYSWVSGSDYPIEARQEGRQGSTTIRLEITQWGRVADCTIIKSSGHADLDAATCSVIAPHTKFEPATDANSKPVRGTLEHTVNWRLDEQGASVARPITTAPPSMIINRVRYPKSPWITGTWYRPTGRDAIDAGMKEGEKYKVPISFMITPEGTIAECKVLEPVENAKVNAASCALLDRAKKITPALDIDGKPTAGRMERTINWYATRSETTVSRLPSYRATPRPISMPDMGTGKTGFELEHDADGKLLSCQTIKEGNLPRQMDFAVSMCERAKDRGVETITNDAGEKVGRKIEFEMRFKTEETGPAKPEE